jgi:hypothetical protein
MDLQINKPMMLNVPHKASSLKGKAKTAGKIDLHPPRLDPTAS